MIDKKTIMQLNAGREIDILVAEQVMGWEIETDAVKLKRLNRYISRNAKNCWWRTPEGGWYCDPPSYSSEIAAAWHVVEKMKSKGRSLFLIQRFDENKVAFDDESASSPDYIADKSLTGAICKAALMVPL